MIRIYFYAPGALWFCEVLPRVLVEEVDASGAHPMIPSARWVNRIPSRALFQRIGDRRARAEAFEGLRVEN